jgi:excisionase family DNA binding protein
MEDQRHPVAREYLSMSDLSIYTGISIRTLRDWIKSGMPHYRIGRLLRVKRSEFDEWVKNFRVDEERGNKVEAIVDEVLRDMGMPVRRKRTEDAGQRGALSKR